MKLALGTVQFGLNYGVNNPHGIPPADTLIKIFTLAKEQGIEILDTAPSYGDAEAKLGYFGVDTFKIVSKFSRIKNQLGFIFQLIQTLQNLRQDKIYAYIAHNADELINKADIWEMLLKAKKSGKVEKIGYSLYTPDQLELLLDKHMIPDMVQLPYSLLDRKFEPFFEKLKDFGIEIHIRSVFLQGLYFMDPELLPIKLSPLKDALKRLHSCCDDYQVSPGTLALNFVATNPFIDHVVIGVDTLEQLQDNIERIKNWQVNEELIAEIKKICVIHQELLNPANW